jgi:mutual gliding-motility protein MglA
MATISASTKTVSMKVVYYGPGLCGKTTNLVKLHTRFPEAQRGALIKLDTETERTLFFEYFLANMGSIDGYNVKVNYFTVPGQSFHNATRSVVLDGADGVVFVADSSPLREEANLVSFDNMRENLARFNRKLEDIPLVFQWNKRDVPKAISEKTLHKALNPKGFPSFPAVASEGKGVWETEQAILKLSLEKLQGQQSKARGLYG